MSFRGAVIILLACMGLCGCMHLKGVVLEDPSGRPLATAKLSVGRPGSMGIAGEYGVDSRGQFDFHIAMLDENRVFVYDGSGPADMTMRRLEASELSEHMQLVVRRARPGMLPGSIQP